jgi:hypothetical protein
MRRYDEIDEECFVFDSISRSQLPPDDAAYISPASLDTLVQLAIRRMEMRASRIASEIAEAGIDPRL